MKNELKGIDGLIKDNDTSLDYSVSNKSSKESMIEIVINNLLSTDDIDMKSRVKPKQIIPLTKLFVYGEHFQIPLAADIAKQILRLSISESGLGRKELTEIVRGLPSEPEGMFDPLNLKQSLFGK